MTKCINISHPDYRRMLQESGLDSLDLSTRMGVWMQDNQTDEWPTLEQLSVSNVQFNLATKDITVLPLKGNEALYEHYKLLDSNGKVKGLSESVAKQYAKSFNDKGSDHTMIARHTTDGKWRVFIVDNTNYNISDKAVEGQDKAIVDAFISKVLVKVPNIQSVEWIDASQLPKILGVNLPKDRIVNAFVDKGKVYLVKGRVTTDIAIEELLHPLVYALSKENTKLFDKLLKEVLTKSEFKQLKQRILKDYADKSMGYINNELITQALATVTRQEIENNPKGNTFLELVTEFFEWLATWLNNALNLTGNTFTIKAADLYAGFSLRDLAKVLNTNDIVITTDVKSTDISFNKVEDTKQALADAAANKQLNTTGTKYIDTTVGDEYTRVSDVMKGMGYKVISDNVDKSILTEASELGTDVHTLLANKVTGTNNKTVKYTLSERADDQLARVANTIRRNSVEVIAEQLLVDKDKKIAGTADYITFDRDGSMTILDLKTNKSGKRFANYNSKGMQAYSPAETDALQMSIYASMASNTTNKSIKSIKVIKAVPIIGDNNVIEKFESLSIEDLPINKDYEKVTDSHVEEFTDSRPKSKLDKVVDIAIATFENRLEFLSKKSHKLEPEQVKATEELLDKLRLEERNKSIVDIAKYTHNSIKRVHDDYMQYVQDVNDKKKEVTPQDLYKYKDYVEAYLFLDDILTLTYGLEGSLSAEDKQEIIATDIKDAILMRDEITNGYSSMGLPLLAKALSTYTNYTQALYRDKYERSFNAIEAKKYKDDKEKANAKREYIAKLLDDNSELIQQEHTNLIEKELAQASSDIGYLTRWLDNLMDSPDMIAGSIAKMLAEVNFKTRQAKLEKHQELLELVREYEKAVDKGMLESMTSLYDIMLEKDEKGNTTGYLADRFKHQLKEDYRRVYDTELAKTEQAIAKDPTAKEQLMDDFTSYMYQWKERHAPLDKAAFNNAKIDYLADLVEEGKITAEEYEYYKGQVAYFAKPSNWAAVKVTPTVLKPETIRLIDEFIYTNAWSFRIVADAYKDKYESKQFKKLEELRNADPNDIRIRLYDMFIDMAKEADLLLPLNDRLGYRLPGIESSPMEMAMKAKTAKHKATDWFTTILEDNTTERPDDAMRKESIVTDAYGNEKHYLPTRYIKHVDPEKQSYDLASIYFKYWGAATEYHNKLEIQPIVEMTRYFVNNRVAVKKDSKGNPIYNVANRFAANLESKVATTPKGEKTNTAQQLNDIVNALFYGDRDKDLGTMNVLGKQVDKSKFLDAITKFVSINLLGLNPVVGVSNVLTGETMQKIEALFGSHVSSNSYFKASAVYDRELAKGNFFVDAGTRQPIGLIGLLNQKFDVLNESIDPRYRKDTWGANMASYSTLFVTMQMGEHWMQSRLALAMLNDIKAKDKDGNPIKRKDGKDASILDLYSVKDKKLVFDEGQQRVANWTPQDQFRYQTKLKAVQAQIHGQFNEMEWVAIQRHAVGRMLYQFRKFIVPGVKRRFGKRNYNNRLEEFEEGNYRVFGRFFKNYMLNVLAFKYAIASENWSQMTDFERKQVFKTIAEIGFVTSLIIAIQILRGFADDEDDKDKKAMYLTATYFASRLRSEMLFYVDWQGAYQLMRSPAASLAVVDNFFSLMKQLFDPLEAYKRGPFKGDLKIYHRVVDLIPLHRQIYRIQTIPDRVNLYSW